MKPDDQKQLTDEEFPDFLLKIAKAVVIAAIAVVGAFAWQFRDQQISKASGDWGTFGDYVGGLLNPMVGIATVILVIVSITFQRRELRASLREMKNANKAAGRMSFEQSMFAWLENYHSQIREIEYRQLRGRRALHLLYTNYLSPSQTIAFGETHLDLGNERIQVAEDYEANQAYLRLWHSIDTGLAQMGERKFRAVVLFQKIYHDHITELDAPFRTLHRLLRWIDSSDLEVNDKWHYSTLVRSQLSWPELVFLYYYGLIARGEGLAVYANKYALFEDLGSWDSLLLFGTSDLTACPEAKRPRVRDGNSRWPYTSSAFNSACAKDQLKLPATA